MENLSSQLVGLLETILSGVITIVGIYAIMYINKAIAKVKLEAEKIKGQTEREMAQVAIDRVGELVKLNVIKAQETVVKEIHEVAEDGVIDREELKKVAITVKKDVLQSIPDQTLDLLETQISDIDKYVSAKIEEILVSIKAEK